MKKIKATAIITVILIVAVVSIAAITMQGYLRGEINRTQLLLDSDKLLNSLYDIEAWGLSSLKKIKNNGEEKTTDIINNLRQRSEYDNNISLEGELINQSGLFNINYLYNNNVCRNIDSDDSQKLIGKIFENLLTQTITESSSVSLDSVDIIGMIKNIQLWMCPKVNKNTSLDNKISSNNSKWSYQIAGQFLVDKSELRLIQGLDKSLYYNIKNTITALPLDVASKKPVIKISIDDISPGLMAAILGTSKIEANEFISKLNTNDSSNKIQTIKEYLINQNIYSEKQINKLITMLSAEKAVEGLSSYYIISGHVKMDNYNMSMQTLVRTGKDISIMWRKRGHS